MILYMLVWKISAQLEDFGAHLSTRAPLFPTLVIKVTLFPTLTYNVHACTMYVKRPKGPSNV